MTDRQFRAVLGTVLLACLYYDQTAIIAGIIGFLAFEGLTNWRLPVVVACFQSANGGTAACLGRQPLQAFEAERALRLVVASMLVLALFLFQSQLWWLGWFIGFSMLGAGISGVCPLLTILSYLGCK